MQTWQNNVKPENQDPIAIEDYFTKKVGRHLFVKNLRQIKTRQ